MKEIKLKIDKKVYRDIREHLMVKKLSDNFGGVVDSAMGKIISYMDDDKKELTLKYKKDSE